MNKAKAGILIVFVDGPARGIVRHMLSEAPKPVERVDGVAYKQVCPPQWRNGKLMYEVMNPTRQEQARRVES